MYRLMQESKTNYACIICGAEFYFNGADWTKNMHHLLIKHTQIEHDKLQDKLSRRNMQIRELKKDYNRIINSLSTNQLNKIFNPEVEITVPINR